MDSLKILGIRVDRVSMEDSMNIFESFLHAEDGLKAVYTPNPEIIYDAQTDPLVASVLNKADLAIPDGIAVVKASEILGKPAAERVTGIDFSRNALDVMAKNHLSAFLLGAKPGVAEKAGEELRKQNPDIIIAGTHDGYFKENEEDRLVKEINESGAAFLLVALGAPKQELFIERHRAELSAKVAVGIGGSFDVWSGNIDRAPEFFIKHNLEWLHRLIKEPKRLKRMMKIPKFLKLVEKQAAEEAAKIN